MVLNVNDTQTDLPYLIEKLGIREPIWRVLEEVARQPIMVGDVVILREESALILENSSDLLKPIFPVRHVMQNSEIEDHIERSVLVGKIRNVTFHDSCSTSIFGQSRFGALDHLRITIDGNNATCTKVLNFSCNALAWSATNVEDIEPFSTSAKGDELRDHVLPQPLSPQTTVYVNGFRPIHPHPKTLLPQHAPDPAYWVPPPLGQTYVVPTVARSLVVERPLTMSS